MKNFYTLLACIAFPATMLAQAPTVTNLNFPIQHADVSVIDLDGDGLKDILISGENNGGKALKAFKNNGNGTFSEMVPGFPFTPVTRATIDWNDINQDGKPDILISGSIDELNGTDKSVQLFTSNGAGTFTSFSVANLTAVAPGCGFADLNNDGYTDFFVFGNKWQGKSAIYMNDKAGGFIKTTFNDYDLLDSDVTLVDFDNDGDLDIFLMGKNGGAEAPISLILRNDNGVFTPINSTGIVARADGSSAWGDVDGDGYLDLLINGWGDWDGESMGDVVRLYKNNGDGTFTKVAMFPQFAQGSTGGGVRLADWNNDGKLDVFVTGWNGILSRQATAIYLNNGDLTFTEYAYNNNLPGVGESSIAVADINNDGKLDLVVTGNSFNDFGGYGGLGGKSSAVIFNNTASSNAAPSAPTNISATGNQAELTLSWSAATDDSTPANSLSYNIFVKDDNGKYYYAPLANETTGNLLVQRLGNVQLNKTWKIKGLPAGNYQWGVQAIDNSFAASTFAKGTFTIAPDGTLPVVLQHFKATKENNAVKLNWVTQTELNNAYFEVEKSADGKIFSLLKHEVAQSGAASYTVYDKAPYNGINYYRLKQFDKDGKATTLGVEAVNFSLSAPIEASVYPNPVVSDINIALDNAINTSATVSIVNLNGQSVYNQQHKINGNSIHISQNLPSGLYLLKLQGTGLNQTLKIIVK